MILTPPTFLVVGLNAAHQKRFVLPDRLVPGQVHRATHLSTGVGGKGQDVWIALVQCLQSKTESVACAQFLGQGPAGDAVEEMMREHTSADSFHQDWTVRSKAPLRTCTSIVGKDVTTELVEPSGDILPQEWKELLERLSRGTESVEKMALMGSLPPGCPETAYMEIYECVTKNNSKNIKCLIDSLAGLDHLLPILKGNSVLKINRDELIQLAHADTGDDLQTILHNLPSHYQRLSAIAITDGKDPAYVWHENELYQLPVSRLDNAEILYPIGAGDAVAAGFLAAWENNDDLVQAFRYGLACGSASCLNVENSVFTLEQVLDLLDKMGEPSKVGYSKVG